MQKKTPLALIAWIQSQSASLTSKKSSLRVTPALFSRMSRRPKRSTVRATSASMSFRFDVSVRRNAALPPAVVISAVVCSPVASSISATTTCAPSRA